MNLKNLGKVALAVLFATQLTNALDKVAPRPAGTYPSRKRLVVLPVGIIGLNYGLAFLERKLGLNDRNTKFPFKD